MRATSKRWMALLLTAVGAAGVATAGPKARLFLKSRNTLDVELITRNAMDTLSVRRVDAPGVTTVQIPQISRTFFQLDLGGVNVEQLYWDEKFAEVAAALAPALEPTYRFADLPNNNLLPFIKALIKALYWSGQYGAVSTTCDVLIGNPDAGPAEDWARVFKALSILRLVGVEQASALFSAIDEPKRGSDNVGAYHYARAVIRMAEGKISEAQEHAAQVVITQVWEPEWFAAGLYVSAQAYAKAKRYDVARQIVEEINLLYPQTRWAGRAKELGTELEGKGGGDAAPFSVQ